jgi:hypothetical protein
LYVYPYGHGTIEIGAWCYNEMIFY